MKTKFTNLLIYLSVFLLLIISATLVAQIQKPSKDTTPSQSNVEQKHFQLPVFNRLLEVDRTKKLVKQIEGFLSERLKTEPGSVRGYAISPDGKQIMYSLSIDIKSTYDLYYFKVGMQEPKKIGEIGSFDKSIMFPFQVQFWINNHTVLLQAFDSGDGQSVGIMLYNVGNFTVQKLPIHSRHIETPILYDNNSKLFYYVLSGTSPMNPELGLNGNWLYYYYDLKTHKELQLQDIPKEVQQKIYDKKSFVPDGQNFLLSPESNVNGCNLVGTPPLNLPWPCNKAMLVGRTGPEDCYGLNGQHCNYDYPTSNYDFNHKYGDCGLVPGANYQPLDPCPMQTCGHRKPAIDFGDGGLWFQTGTDVLASAAGEAQRREQPVGAGNYVIMRHQRIGYPTGTFVYTVYMHLSWVDPNIPMSPANNLWSSILQKGHKIGKEGKTGGQTSEHYHFELKDNANESGSFYPVFAEYGGCTPKTGRAYISKNIPTDGSMQNGFDCNNVTTITCNTTLSNQSNVGFASRYATYGSGYHGRIETSPERIYKITTTSTGTITASLSNVSYAQTPGNGNDFDVFILKSLSGSCANLNPIDDCVGTSNNVTAQYLSAPAGTYFIIIDGEKNSTGSFTLTVTAPCSGGGGGGFNCNNAITLSNGVPYIGSNSGGGSNVSAYSCINWAETGPEKVHSFAHIGGTITINLVQFGSDVDAFLLGSCSITNCLLSLDSGVGTTSSTLPLGIYYIVVDGYQGAVGSYTLTVSSSSSGGGGGGFNCNNAVALSNGVPYYGTNSGGGNNVSIYNCSSWQETGPEKVHSFVHTGGNISMNLAQSGGVDVDAFLLGSCSPTNCLKEVDNGLVTTTNSQPPGTYFVVVDGYQGAVGSYTLTVSSSGGGGGGLPNLIENGSSRIPSGRNITILTSIKNDGTANVGPAYFRTKFVLSYDIYLGNDFHLGYLNYNNVTILPGGTYNFSFNWTIPSSIPAGTYYLIETLDYDNVIAESDNNNSYYFYGTFYVPPGLAGGGGEENNNIATFELTDISEHNELALRSHSTTNSIQPQQINKSCEVSVRGLNIEVSNVDFMSEYLLYNALGNIICKGRANVGNIQCKVNISGVYFIYIVDGSGNKCVEKLFVN